MKRITINNVLLIIYIVGFLILNVFARLLRDNKDFRDSTSDFYLFSLILLISVVTIVSFALWGFIKKSNTEQKAFSFALLIIGLLCAIFQAVLPLADFMEGNATKANILIQALIYGISLMGWVVGFFWIYRIIIIKSHNKYFGMIYFIIIIILNEVGTLLGDNYLLSNGVLIFKNGYSIFWDMLYCLSIFILPLIIYKIILIISKIGYRVK